MNERLADFRASFDCPEFRFFSSSQIAYFVDIIERELNNNNDHTLDNINEWLTEDLLLVYDNWMETDSYKTNLEILNIFILENPDR